MTYTREIQLSVVWIDRQVAMSRLIDRILANVDIERRQEAHARGEPLAGMAAVGLQRGKVP